MGLVDFSLKDKVAVVTGSSRGIGESIARAYAELGAKVVLVSRKQESLDAVAESIRNDGGECLPVACHAGDPDAIAKMFETVVSEYGTVDVLVNNAATNPYFGPALNMEMSAFDKTFEVNVRGYFLMAQHAGRIMVEKQSGSIINVASIAALSPGPMQAVYSMTKAAVVNMTKGFAKELGSANVRSNAICPGLVETKFASVLVNTPEIYEQFVQTVPMQRHAQPEELVGIAAYLASDHSSYTTGGVFVVDGGSVA